MGTNVFLDIIGSVIIGGILLITLFRLSGRATENTYNKSGDLTIQQNIASIVRVFENDFRKIGYCADWKKMPDPQKSIIFWPWPLDEDKTILMFYSGCRLIGSLWDQDKLITLTN